MSLAKKSPRRNTNAPQSRIFSGEELESLKTTFYQLSNNQETLSIQKYLSSIEDLQLQTDKPTLKFIFQKIQNSNGDEISYEKFICLLEESIGDFKSEKDFGNLFANFSQNSEDNFSLNSEDNILRKSENNFVQKSEENFLDFQKLKLLRDEFGL